MRNPGVQIGTLSWDARRKPMSRAIEMEQYVKLIQAFKVKANFAYFREGCKVGFSFRARQIVLIVAGHAVCTVQNMTFYTFFCMLQTCVCLQAVAAATGGAGGLMEVELKRQLKGAKEVCTRADASWKEYEESFKKVRTSGTALLL